MNEQLGLTKVLTKAIGDGYKTVKVIITSCKTALVLVRNLGRWFHYATTESAEVIRKLRAATGNAFNITKLIDRVKLNSGCVDQRLGSMVLRYRPANIADNRLSNGAVELGTLTLTGLRLMPEELAV